MYNLYGHFSMICGKFNFFFRSNRRSESSGDQPGRPAQVKEPIKFANEFDFEQANEEYKDLLSKFEVRRR